MLTTYIPPSDTFRHICTLRDSAIKARADAIRIETRKNDGYRKEAAVLRGKASGLWQAVYALVAVLRERGEDAANIATLEN